MRAFEQEFERRLAAFDADARTCAIYAYTDLALNNRVGSDPDLLDRLNLHPRFWNTITGALQVGAFVALGRIFDDTRNTDNVGELLAYAEDHPGIFSRAALIERKVADNLPRGVAVAYAAQAHEFRKGASLKQLSENVEAMTKFYQAQVQPIRHKVFAHAGRISPAQRDAYFRDLKVRELEAICVFPMQVHRALFDLYHNGREPAMSDAVTLTRDVLDQDLQPGTSTWEHVHAAKSTDAFLDWLRLAPEEE